MKEKTIILVLLIFAGIILKAQQNPPLSVFSDRDVYISGETMLVKVFAPISDQSKVSYLDLLNMQGKRVSGAILEINNHQADGFLSLPDSLSTGTYILRSYAKSTASKIKVVKEIWITNRFVGLEKTKQIPRLALNQIKAKEISSIKIDHLPEVLKANSDNSLNVVLDENLVHEIDGDLTIYISQYDNQFKSKSALLVSEQKNKTELSEQKGLILSGTVTDKKTALPASGINVLFTIPDSIPEFQYYQTAANGKFYFQLSRYSGSIQPFIQCFSSNPLQRLKLTLDDSFTEAETIPSFTMEAVTDTFTISNARNIDAITFQKIFEQQSFKIQEAPKEKTTEYPYYGKPNKIVDPHLFIDLPDFTEISRELLSGVKFRNYNNEPSLQVLNSATSSFFDEMPLTLIDGIPVRDLNLIKEMGTQNIKRVEICNTERYYGNLKFPGVVAIYTIKGDYSNIKENDQLIHPTLDTVQPKVVMSEMDKKDQNIPDLRQVLHWSPALKPQQSVPVNFKTSSVLGKYRISVLGRLKDGSVISEEKQFEVK